MVLGAEDPVEVGVEVLPRLGVDYGYVCRIVGVAICRAAALTWAAAVFGHDDETPVVGFVAETGAILPNGEAVAVVEGYDDAPFILGPHSGGMFSVVPTVWLCGS